MFVLFEVAEALLNCKKILKKVMPSVIVFLVTFMQIISTLAANFCPTATLI